MASGRKSEASKLGVVPISGARLPPPEHLDDAERAEWSAIVNSLPADYFRPGDAPLLAAFCLATVFYKAAAKSMREEGLWLVDPTRGRRYVNPAHAVLTSQASSMAQIATKLRLAPNARMGAGHAATKTKRGPGGTAAARRPWETGTE